MRLINQLFGALDVVCTNGRWQRLPETEVPNPTGCSSKHPPPPVAEKNFAALLLKRRISLRARYIPIVTVAKSTCPPSLLNFVSLIIVTPVRVTRSSNKKGEKNLFLRQSRASRVISDTHNAMIGFLRNRYYSFTQLIATLVYF